MTDLKALEQRTREVYERNAAAFDRQRLKQLYERKWLDRFTENLREGARILDLGCGAGEPIASYLIAGNFQVTGVDFSSSMLAIARQRFPDHTWHRGDMRELDLPERFDGITRLEQLFPSGICGSAGDLEPDCSAPRPRRPSDADRRAES